MMQVSDYKEDSHQSTILKPMHPNKLAMLLQAPFRLSLASINCDERSTRRLANALRNNPRHHRQWTIEMLAISRGGWMVVV